MYSWKILKVISLCAGLCALNSLVSAQVGENRIWTAADGREIEARLDAITEDSVEVTRLSDRTKVTIPRSMLSAPDQEFLTSLVKKEAVDEKREGGFKEGKYADAVKGEWVKYGKEDLGILFQLYIGKEVTRKKAGPEVPLFIHLHGAGARADDVEAGKVEIAAQEVARESFYEDHPCVICVPTCPPDPMTWNKQRKELERLVDDLVANLPIDRNRIYLSGYSQGGQGIGKMLQSRPDYYAAAVFADGGPDNSWIGKVKTPLWSYYSGDRDSSKAPEQQEKFQEDGVEFRFNILPKVDHNSIHWKLAKDPEVFEWVFEQQKK